MLAVLMAISAFVIAVAALGVALWTMFAASDGLQRQDSHLERMSDELRRISNASPTALKAELDALGVALDTHRAQTRQEFGKLWGKFTGAERGRPIIDTVRVPNGRGDDDFEAMIQLQGAPPARP
jgi:hypothetical protein